MDCTAPCRTLHHAARNGDVDTIKHCLITGGSEYINTRDSFGMTPAMLAAMFNGGSAECLKLLLNAGADVNTRDMSGLTVWLSAAKSGRTSCVQVLLDACGSKYVNISGDVGQTPIMLAARSSGDNVECLELLLNAGANIYTCDMYGSTALFYAAESGNVRCIQALLNAGASKHVNTSNHEGQSPIMLAAAAEKNNVECVKLLLKAGADMLTFMQ